MDPAERIRVSFSKQGLMRTLGATLGTIAPRRYRPAAFRPRPVLTGTAVPSIGGSSPRQSAAGLAEPCLEQKARYHRYNPSSLLRALSTALKPLLRPQVSKTPRRMPARFHKNGQVREVSF